MNLGTWFQKPVPRPACPEVQNAVPVGGVLFQAVLVLHELWASASHLSISSSEPSAVFAAKVEAAGKPYAGQRGVELRPVSKQCRALCKSRKRMSRLRSRGLCSSAHHVFSPQ